MSIVFTTTKELQSFLQKKKSIGFVPTMGNLHKGHLSLLKESYLNNETTVISIFVNSTQFSDEDDYSNYPRTFNSDKEKIDRLEYEFDQNREIIIFSPQDECEIYPQGKTVMSAFGPHKVLEGKIRPGHFDGVVTVVKRLFEIVKPCKAYFGKKDFQQLHIIKELNHKFNFNIEIISMPIIREQSGLAMSSRNKNLQTNELEQALALRTSLLTVKSLIENDSSMDYIEKHISEILKNDSCFNYLVLCNHKSLTPANNLDDKLVVLGNYQIGTTSLLDNIEIS